MMFLSCRLVPRLSTKKMTDNGPLKIHIIGHSFVSRLKQFIKSERDLRFDLGLHNSPLVQFNGYPGGSVVRVHQPLEVVEDFSPDIVIVILGTNDIYKSHHPVEEIAGSFYDLVNSLLEMQGPSNVIVCQILHRLTPTVPTRYPVDVDWFNERVDRLNQMLSTNLPYYFPGKSFLWRLKGFWSADSKTKNFAPYGCHLSREGQYCLLSNIRAAAVASIRHSIK